MQIDPVTERVQASGDAKWVTQLQLHDDVSRDLITRQGGRLVKSTGDGVLALFDGPGRGPVTAGDLSASSIAWDFRCAPGFVLVRSR